MKSQSAHHDLKPYPEYRETDISWLGIIPKHWRILPGRACFLEKKVSNRGMQEKSVLSLSYGKIVVKPLEKLHGLVPESFETYQIVEPGNIIIRPTDLQNDWNSLRFGISRNKGIITAAYMCFHTYDLLTHEFGHQLLHTYDIKKIFYGLGSGLRQNMDWRDFKYLPCIIPPIHEQTAIVRFLDHIDRRIKRYIHAKQKLIKLLNEQKQAVIHQAVTRGLDPNVHLKPSGVEWLGDVPEYWNIKPLKRWTIINGQSLSERTDKNYEFRYIDIGTVESGHLVHSPIKLKFGTCPSRARRILHLGDTIVSTVRTYLKAVWYVNENSADLVASTGFAVLTPQYGVEPEYLGYVIQSPNFVNRVSAHSTGTAYPAITETTLGRFPIALPSKLKDQCDIVNWIKLNTTNLENTMTTTQNEIALLQEYRTRLIADVVTGKLDVRAAAAQLPEELEDIEPIEEEEICSEDEDNHTDVELDPEEEES